VGHRAGVGFFLERRRLLLLPGNEPRTVQHVAGRYTGYAIPASWIDNIKMDYKKIGKEFAFVWSRTSDRPARGYSLH